MSGEMRIMRAENPCFDPGLVVAAYCRLRGVNRTELLEGESRVRSVTLPRHELMWLLRELTTLSLTAIGRLMGGRDVATVKAGIDGIADRAAADAGYRDQLAQARAYVMTFASQDAAAPEDAGAVISRRLLLAGPAQRADVEAVAITMLAIGAMLRSEELTDAEARRAALTLIRNAGGGHG